MSNKVLIIGTGKHPSLPKGIAHYEIPELAEILVSIGRAVYDGTPLEESEKVQVAPEKKKQIKKPSTKKTL
jgi:hypothetical protein